MLVPPDREAAGLAVAPAELLPGYRQLGHRGDPDLALAVIALGAGLEDAGQRRRLVEVGRAADRLGVGGPEPGLAEELLLAQPVLGEVDRPHARPHRLVALAGAHGRLGHVLEFVGDDVDPAGEAGEGCAVVVLALDMGGYLARDRIGFR